MGDDQRVLNVPQSTVALGVGQEEEVPDSFWLTERKWMRAGYLGQSPAVKTTP